MTSLLALLIFAALVRLAFMEKPGSTFFAIALLACLFAGGCVQHSDGAKISTVVNVSLMPATAGAIPGL